MPTFTKTQLTTLFTTAALVALPFAANAAPNQSSRRGAAVADGVQEEGRSAKKAKRQAKKANKPKTEAEFAARLEHKRAKENKKHARRTARIEKLEQHLRAKPGGTDRIAKLNQLEQRRHNARIDHMSTKRFGEKVAKADRKAKKQRSKALRGEFKNEMKQARADAGLPSKAERKAKRANKGERKAGAKGKRGKAKRGASLETNPRR